MVGIIRLPSRDQRPGDVRPKIGRKGADDSADTVRDGLGPLELDDAVVDR